LLLGVAIGAVSLLPVAFGLGAVFATPPEVTEARILAQAAGALMLVCGSILLVGSIRSLFAGVRIDVGSVAIRTTWRKRTFTVDQVQGFEVGATTGAIPLIPYCALEVLLSDDTSIVVRETRALSRRRATEAVALANDRLSQLKRGC
jgi:hypothetical protein